VKVPHAPVPRTHLGVKVHARPTRPHAPDKAAGHSPTHYPTPPHAPTPHVSPLLREGGKREVAVKETPKP